MCFPLSLSPLRSICGGLPGHPTMVGLGLLAPAGDRCPGVGVCLTVPAQKAVSWLTLKVPKQGWPAKNQPTQCRAAFTLDWRNHP